MNIRVSRMLRQQQQCREILERTPVIRVAPTVPRVDPSESHFFFDAPVSHFSRRHSNRKEPREQ
jgi:hypothetical protein